MNNLSEKIYKLIVDTSSRMPDDVTSALSEAAENEKKAGNTLAFDQLSLMLENIRLAEENSLPLCQDTGTINFYIDAPADFNRKDFQNAAEKAIIKATDGGILRKNSICTITGKNSGNNIGPGTPQYYWNISDGETSIKLLLKGGGSENVGIQYSLPDTSISADRDMEGVKKCILDAAVKAQGKGCPPSIISVCIGGDRASGYAQAKKAFFRKIGERSNDPKLAEFEKEVLKEVNNLGIGPMGLGGKTFALDVFVSSLNRHPASFFVTISQMCWSSRRGCLELRA